MRKVRVTALGISGTSHRDFSEKFAVGQMFIGESCGGMKPSQVKRLRRYFLAIGAGLFGGEIYVSRNLPPYSLVINPSFPSCGFPKIRQVGVVKISSAWRGWYSSFARGADEEIGKVFSICGSASEDEAIPAITIRPARQPQNVVGIYFPEQKAMFLSTREFITSPIVKELAAKLGLELVKGVRKRLMCSNTAVQDINITLGTDPEFEESESTEEYRPIYTNVEGGTSAPVGRDGAGAQIEIRPQPASDPKQLVENIRTLISQCPPIAIKGDRFPLGGHIHFGGIRPETGALKVLDDFLGKKLINLSGRARSSYKRLGAFETKTWGFEYRTLPSAWLHNPEISYIVLKLAKKLMEKLFSAGRLVYYVEDNNELGAVKEEYRKYLSAREVEKFFNFIDNYSAQAAQIINANWIGGRRGRRRVKAAITFRDEWNSRIKGQLEQLISAGLRGRPYELVLFGLSANRGEVCNYRSKVFGQINDFPIFENGKIKIGLPYSFRSGQLEMSAPGTVEKVAKEIIRRYKRTVRVERNNNRTREE